MRHIADASEWLKEFTTYDWECRRIPDDDCKLIEVDSGRWFSIGFVIARKPDPANILQPVENWLARVNFEIFLDQTRSAPAWRGICIYLF